MTPQIVVLGIFVADTAYRSARMPRLGETLMGTGFALGPGGKGSNQAVAAARAGGDVAFLGKLGRDVFADMALRIWDEAGVRPLVTHDPDGYTGAAFIHVEDATGDNAIVVAPGVAATLTPSDMDAAEDAIAGARVFVTQLEQPMDAARRALEIARAHGTVTILNPAPAAPLDDALLSLCDHVTPNETEAADLTGRPVTGPEDALAAARALLDRGVRGAAIVTLGAQGAVALTKDGTAIHVPARHAGPVAETTGAGDAFNGGLAVALSEGRPLREALDFANATAAISVTRPGTAPSMPDRTEIDALMAGTAD
ncbi:MAG: ribokinase [Paracoccaceae bacterium]